MRHFLYLFCITGWISITYEVSTIIWPLSYFYSVMGASACLYVVIDLAHDWFIGKPILGVIR